MTPVLIILALVSPALVAILSRTYLKAKELERGPKSLRRELALLQEQNAELRQRIEVLETIATDGSLALERGAPTRALPPGDPASRRA